MTRFTRWLLAAAVMLMAAMISPYAVQAGGETTQPNAGPEEPGLTPGENDYKVFDPGAIKELQAQRTNAAPDDVERMAAGRAGLSDIYRTPTQGSSSYTINGSHSSESDLVEDEIFADGGLRASNEPGYSRECHDHTAGQFAHCNTDRLDGDFANTWIAHSWHFFRKSGWIDQNMETEDSLNS